MVKFLNFKFWSKILIILIVSYASCKGDVYDDKTIIIENGEMRLIISENGYAKSLIYKATGQECLNLEENVSVFAVKQYNSLPGPETLLYPYNPRFSYAKKVQRNGDKLIVTFDGIPDVVTLQLKITDSYIGLNVSNIENGGTQLSQRLMKPLDELFFFRLPVRERDHFGEWLNVMYDKNVAVNVLGTDQYCKISSEKRSGYRIMEACAVDDIKTLGVGAALIVTETKNLLNHIEQLENDFNLAPGVKNRRSKESRLSYYWATDITPDNVDQHIKYARKGGFKLFMISSNSFAMPASFTWLPAYSNGIKDLKEVVDKINNAGIIAGVHLYYTKSDKKDVYVTGVPDHRLGLRKIFTLAEPISESSSIITVEENPRTCTMKEGRRILKIGKELITYQDYTNERPYQFTGCNRGYLQTKVYAREKGFKLGLLDVDTWDRWIRFDQQTSIQQEVAERIGDIYNQAGFQFIYLDGAEDVNPPFWYNIPHSQKVVLDQFKTPPIFTESAVHTHFSWHMIDRANAFDLQEYSPERLKDVTRNYPMREALMLKDDFSKGDFGWVANYPAGYRDGDAIGMQPDMIEFSTSRAAGWDTGTSLWTELSWTESNPRSEDIFEVFRRWETVRKENWLTEEQKAELRNPDQEHILLIDENGEFELRPYFQIPLPQIKEIRAFHFKREGKIYVVYWDTLGEGQLIIPIREENIRLFNSLDRKPLKVKTKEGNILIPAGSRRYLECTNMSESQVIEAFKNLKIKNF